MGLSLLSQPAQAINWDFFYTLVGGGVFTGRYITDGSSIATDIVYNVTGISGTIDKNGTTRSISGLGGATPSLGNNTFKWDGIGIGVTEWGIEFSDSNGGVYNLTGPDPSATSYAFTGQQVWGNPVAITNGDLTSSSVTPPTAVPWETDALPVIGSTILFAGGLWARNKFAKPLQK